MMIVIGVLGGIVWLAYTTWDSIKWDRDRNKPKR